MTSRVPLVNKDFGDSVKTNANPLIRISHSAFTVLLSILLSICVVPATEADEIRVAVASNFTVAIKALVAGFEQQTGHKVVPVFGSTGKHYAQIRNGAPFQAFFAADSRRPQLLEEEGIAEQGSRFTYAVGKLVLWSPQVGVVDADGKVLTEGNFTHLALANPKLAPYGEAAQELLRQRGLWQKLRGRMVRGENIGQTFQFVKSGNAELGFVARSQIQRPGQPISGSLWDIPQSFYSPIRQQAVLLKNHPVAREFLNFVRTENAREIIRSFGYGVL